MINIPNYTPFEYQKDSINNVIEIANINGGSCIYDETGLGKTITSLTSAINLGADILVISPVSNKKSWIKVSSFLDSSYNVTVTTAQSISKISDKKYDVVIVDEAHNFRNIKNKSYIELFLLIHKNNAKTLLLTATPFNNNFGELKAMLGLIKFNINVRPFHLLAPTIDLILEQEKIIMRGEAYGYPDMNTEIKAYTIMRDEITLLKEVMSMFTVRNTRAYISANYPNDLSRMGNFPEIVYNTVETEYSSEIISSIYKTISLIDKAPLTRQNIIKYFDARFTNSDFTGLYKSLLFKRLDSSVYAFRKTIQNGLTELEKIYSEKTIIYDDKKHEMDGLFWNEVQKDISIFNDILDIWKDIDDISKLDLLKNIIEKYTDNNQKVVVFTEYNDTLDVIKTYLDNKKVVAYNSSSSDKELEKVVLNFDANQDISDYRNDYNVIVCTDVLSEGTNLHRATVVVHFDSKWNPSKLKQRDGRVDRININDTSTRKVYIERFGTDVLVEEIIKLEKKIDRKNNYFDNIVDISYIKPTFRDHLYNETDVISYSNNDDKTEIFYTFRNEQYDFSIPARKLIRRTHMNTRFDYNSTRLGVLISNFKFNLRELYQGSHTNWVLKHFGCHNLYTTNKLYNQIYSNLVSQKNVPESVILNVKNASIYNENIKFSVKVISKTGLVYMDDTISASYSE
jgi:superfamily II DNA or RNA helicase